MRNALYFGDNLKVMRDMQTARYHTCYLDPPYNSGRNYNIFIAGSKAQRKAFDDIWRWDDAARENQDAVLHYDGRHPELVETMDTLGECLIGFNNILKGGGISQKMRQRQCVPTSPSWPRGWRRFGGC
ncbi:hypothetical protein C6495_16310 [Candidatus Poribacteria bacterium]|nr:MAG: hypothetical protein C6495_16310 [Candidatus Poribacteria bacterium]